MSNEDQKTADAILQAFHALGNNVSAIVHKLEP